MLYRSIQASLALAGFCVLIAASGAPARAADPQSVTETISLSGLNLALQADAKLATYRIQRAATALCTQGPIESRADRQAFRACKLGAERDAMAQLDNLVAAAKGDRAAILASR
jgi:UrcA family protein